MVNIELHSITLIDLWLPILVSAVAVFIVSSIIHMFLGYHANDFKQLPKEDEAMNALRPLDIPPGDYMMPRAGSMKEMGSPEYLEKTNQGPVAMMTVMPNGCPSMTDSLVMWFFYSILVSIFAAYICVHAVGANAHYLEVFRFVGAAALMGYSMALLQNSIWYKKDWCATLKSAFDGLIYALVTAGVFGWLWPTM